MRDMPEKFRTIGYFWDYTTARRIKNEQRKNYPTKKYGIRFEVIEYEG